MNVKFPHNLQLEMINLQCITLYIFANKNFMDFPPQVSIEYPCFWPLGLQSLKYLPPPNVTVCQLYFN